ncbi:inositol 2-dehydrogenase [Phocoenobacter skyensis]|uniref:Inositol 2-dehydrogenase n=1 Tax=Phocoenobacter skyensis TaxID=97481 RepID=A0A1H7WEC0_9PAST|nr:inositol 2-dehydrogenase [Pasteurella skyensis]MDP8079192.1 inositol 2-dehydrogenase [Pasteurella skyensis]MDP8085198.1 inositol 2-dehydrogenase [Pasteurella skyensis]MDP8185114.1 inositol 2-dehydrogenase [Pasteurella skyensis]QLB22202.1 inositol 2-dehydrogenase [Pasteurella skyensis]SEM19810.1 myo-inositol 2-dehydrogenase / D-chiro-inositol 1-dehydrogenase [Pasteurella skyensis]
MYNVALLGAGRIGLVHAVNIVNHPETTLYSVADPYEPNAKKMAEKYGCKIQTIEEVMADPNVHAVLIASATDTHADLIELSARAGKTIFCEKPIHLDMARVKECLKVVEEYNVPLFIGFNRRYDPQFRQVKERLQQGQIGKPESLIIISRDPSPPPAAYVKVSGGLFRDMAIHDFDMARFIMGEDPVSVYASGSCLVNPEIGEAGDIDTAFVVMRFPSGAMATISNTRRSGYGYDQRLELHGEKGVLTAKNIYEDSVELWTDEGCKYAKPEFFFLQRYDAAYKAEWEHFVDILNGKAKPATTGIDGMQALYLADKALESLQTGKEVKL